MDLATNQSSILSLLSIVRSVPGIGNQLTVEHDGRLRVVYIRVTSSKDDQSVRKNQ